MAAICMASFLSMLIFLANFSTLLADEKKPPLIFVLGDSTADVGTNNYLNSSKATANFPRNGVDFPHSRPTGRFSNGLNSADWLAKLFGLERSPPPFLFLRMLRSDQFKKRIYGGVNFASGGAGILDDTGKNLTVVCSSEQITQLASVRDNFTAMIGRDATKELLCKALFFISIGSNDIFVYFSNNGTKMPGEEFMSLLISTYSNHITTLYQLGARKFGIIGVPPVGCCPVQRLEQKVINGKDGCFDQMNDFAFAFHSNMDNLLRNISSQLPGMKYSLGNTYNMTYDVISNPGSGPLQFENVTSACCGHGTLFAEGPCNKSASLCPDRHKFLFWDKFHPTQKASFLAAQALYSGSSPYYASPINFSQLAEEN